MSNVQKIEAGDHKIIIIEGGAKNGNGKKNGSSTKTIKGPFGSTITYKGKQKPQNTSSTSKKKGNGGFWVFAIIVIGYILKYGIPKWVINFLNGLGR